jgi:hypothetical protein
LSGNEVRWHFEDFEPASGEPVQNMEFALVAPSVWGNIVRERDNVTRTPADGEAWGRLGKLYKSVFLLSKGYREDLGGEELYRLSVEAYEKCLALKPEDAQWHAGPRICSPIAPTGMREQGPPDTYRALEEIRTALQLAPGDPVVQEIAQNISYLIPDGMTQTGSEYDFPWLTQTPTPRPPTPTIAPVYDPEAISGTYQSEPFNLSNGEEIQLKVTLEGDHSAQMESSYENYPPFISDGSWTDNGDGTITLRAADPQRGEVEIVFTVEAGSLKGYVPFYGEAGIELSKVIATASSTPSPTATEAPPPAPAAPIPTPQAANPLCGSAALIPLAGIVVLRRKRR